MTSREESFLELQSLSKSYGGGILAVDRVSLSLRRGEFVVFLGPSGSGKTTTLMMIAGFETPSAGAILLEGRALNAIPAYKRGLGVVFQNYALFPHLTVLENVAFPLSMRNLKRAEAEERARRAIDMVALGPYESRRPQELSGGQQQRVALARALVFNPKVLLLDEPLGALDKNLREQMQREIRSIHGQHGVTSIYVTHDQSEAFALADRIAIFNGGEIVQVSEPERLYGRPATKFVATFLGESNFLPGDDFVRAVDREASGSALQDTLAAGGGAIAEIMVRPESFTFERPEEPAVALDFLVEDRIFVGDRYLLGCRSGALPFRVNVSAERYERHGIGAGRPVRGWIRSRHMVPFDRDGKSLLPAA